MVKDYSTLNFSSMQEHELQSLYDTMLEMLNESKSKGEKESSGLRDTLRDLALWLNAEYATDLNIR